MDFGLAHGRTLPAIEQEHSASGTFDMTPRAEHAFDATIEADSQVQPEFAALAARLTRVGSIQGTPAYMAPEQWEGQETQAATDQFEWAVMAWELLYGERPFAGTTIYALATAVMSGQRRPPPRGRSVPGWLRRVIERGLAVEPSGRWPTMAILLQELERGQTRTRMRTAMVVLAGVVMLGVGMEGYRRWDEKQRVEFCEATGAEIDTEWNEDARRGLRDAFVATGVSYAETTAEKVIPSLDAQAAAWKQARTDVCLNADVRGRWSTELLDRAVWCLEDRHVGLVSLVDQFRQANTTAVEKAVSAVASMKTVDSCMDEGLLQRQPAPPLQGRETIREVRAELSRASSLGRIGKFKQALEVAVEARVRAEKILDWPPLLAAARAQEGYSLERMGQYEESEKVLTEAYFEAARLGASETAASAATNLIFTLGYQRARHAEGRAWARHAEVAISLAGDPVGLGEANRLSYVALVSEATGAYAEAQALQERALALREQALGPDHPSIAGNLNNLATVHHARGAYAEARALLERALAIQEKALGPDHPEIAMSLTNLANVYYETGEYAEARALNERVLAIDEEVFGSDHPNVAIDLFNLAGVYFDTGEYGGARSLYERARPILEKALGPDHPEVAKVLNSLARVNLITEGYVEARALSQQALAIQEKALGPDHPDLVSSLNALAQVHFETGEYVEARALYERGLSIREKALGADHPEVAVSLGNLANLSLAEKKPRDALALVERALTIFAAQSGAQPRALEAHFILARALVAVRGDHTRAFAEARAARDGYIAAGAGNTTELAAVEQWLAENDPSGRAR
jgi:tetratricopeptide (TPR) repeat protein